MSKPSLKKKIENNEIRLEHDEHFILKLVGTIGDLGKKIIEGKAEYKKLLHRITWLEKRIKQLEEKIK